jgi:hypothetical protein
MAKGMVDRLTEVGGGCYGLEINVEKKYGNENLKAIIHSTDTIHQKQFENVKYPNYFGS